MPDRMGKTVVGVIRRQPVTTRIDSFKYVDMHCVSAVAPHWDTVLCQSKCKSQVGGS